MFEFMAETAVKVYYGNLMMLPDVSRVLACLHEKDVKFELININKGHLPVPVDFLKLQEKATNRVPGPAFEDGRKILFESRAICRHLAEKYAEQGNKYLLGRDPLERASIEQWLRSEEHSFDPPSWTLVFHLAFAASNMDFEPNRVLIQESERKLSEVLDVYNQRLGESKYLAGNEFSLADLSHLPNSHYIANSKEWSYLITSRKYVKKWWKKISERTSWLKAIKTVEELPVEGRPSLVGGDSKRLVPHQPDAHKTAKSIEKVADKPPSKSAPPRPKPQLPAHQPSKLPTDPRLHEPETHQLTQKSMQNSKPFESVSLPATQAKVAPLSEPPPGTAPHGSKPHDSHQPPTQPSPIEKAAKSTLPELAPTLPTQSKTIIQPESPQSLGSPTQKSQVKKPAKGPMDERIPSTLEPASLFTPKSEFPRLEQGSMETAAGQKPLEQVSPPQTPNLQKDTTTVIPEAPEAAWKSMEKKVNPTLPKPALVSTTESEAYQPSTTSKGPANKKPEPPKPAEKFTEKIESSIVHDIQAHRPRTDQFKRKAEPVKPEQGSIDKIESSTSREPTVVPTTQPGPSQSSTPSLDPLRKKTETLKFAEKYMEKIESSASPEPTAMPTTQPEAPRPAKLPSDPLNTIPVPPRPAQEFKEKVSLLTPFESALTPTPQPEASQTYRPLGGSVRQGPQAPQPTNTSMKERKGPVSPQPASLSTPQLDPLKYEKVVDQTPIESASLSTEPLTGLTTQKPEVPQYEPYPLEKTAAKAPLEQAPSKTPRSDDKPSSRAGSSPPLQADQSSPSDGQQSSPPPSSPPPS